MESELIGGLLEEIFRGAGTVSETGRTDST